MVARKKTRGFTLIELMVVISIILILISVAVPLYQQSIARAEDSVIRQDLWAMRNAIDNYSIDKQKAPQSLEDLVQSGYLSEIPTDPCTRSKDTWQVEQEDIMLAVDQTQPGITNVHSGCQKSGSDGSPISSW